MLVPPWLSADRLPHVTVPCSQQPRHSSGFHSCRQCWGQTFPRSEVQLSVSCSTAWAAPGRPLSFTFLQVLQLPWSHHPTREKMKTVLTMFRKTGIVESLESHNEPALLKLKQLTLSAAPPASKETAIDPGNKEYEMAFFIWKAIKILQQVLFLKCACASADVCKFVINNAYFFESCCCASVLWIFNLSALFNLERFLNGFSCLHSLPQQLALLPPLI